MCPDEAKKPEPEPKNPDMEGVLPIDFAEDRPDLAESIPVKPPDPSKTKFLSDILDDADKTDVICTSSDNISGLSNQIKPESEETPAGEDSSVEPVVPKESPVIEEPTVPSPPEILIVLKEKTPEPEMEDVSKSSIDLPEEKGDRHDIEIVISQAPETPRAEEEAVVSCQEPEENTPETPGLDESSRNIDSSDLPESQTGLDSTLNTSTDLNTTEEPQPVNLNPFGDSEEEEEGVNAMGAVPSPGVCRKVEINEEGKTILEAPKNLNPFWSESDESDEERKPVPKPRTLRTPEPIPRTRFGSSTSLTSQSSSVGKKKRPAPQPPTSGDVLLRRPSSPVSSFSSPSSQPSRWVSSYEWVKLS